MRVVILAAGEGKRFGSKTPKSLSVLDTKETILARQIRLLCGYVEPSELLLVLGYRHELFLESFPGIPWLRNVDYSAQNTAKSLLLALKELDDNVLWLNGDVVFKAEALDQMMQSSANAILVNRALCSEEEVKYQVDEKGFISAISKELNPGLGEALGINRISQKDLQLFCRHLETCSEQDYFERAIEKAIHEGMRFRPVTVDNDACIEIDFPEDLERANHLFRN